MEPERSDILLETIRIDFPPPPSRQTELVPRPTSPSDPCGTDTEAPERDRQKVAKDLAPVRYHGHQRGRLRGVGVRRELSEEVGRASNTRND